MEEFRGKLPEHGRDWDALRAHMESLREGDADWRNARTAVYIFNAGEEVSRVAREAYALYQAENGLGPLAFPSLKRMEDEVVGIGLDLLHGPAGGCGNMTAGGSESILMAVKTCRDQAAAKGRNVVGARVVVPASAHLAFDKACHYLGLEIVRVPLAADYRADPEAIAEALDDTTLMIVGSAPCFPYGLIDPIERLSDLALEAGVWLHVDACVGGYFAPFARMNGVDVPPFDFELPGVASISADLHKYGYAAKGASTIFHRSEEQREFQVFESGNWPGGHMRTPTAAGTRPGGAIASAWAVLHALGVEGYREKARIVCETRARMMAAIDALPDFRTYGEPKLGLFLFGSETLDPFKVYGRLLARGWFSGVVTEPKAIHQMLSPAHAAVVDDYLADLEAAAEEVRNGGEGVAPTSPRYA
ncbi:MAG: aspartate aminotransferase family protein [Myxococcota bacterium]|jgi:sphinganine-1-phosphate aldolase|nr:aspartate aminotransferase family protein [Myxococcota bacterium]